MIFQFFLLLFKKTYVYEMYIVWKWSNSTVTESVATQNTPPHEHNLWRKHDKTQIGIRNGESHRRERSVSVLAHC